MELSTVRTWQLYCRHSVRWTRVFNKINSLDKVLISCCRVGLGGEIYSVQENVFLLWRSLFPCCGAAPRSSSVFNLAQTLISRNANIWKLTLQTKEQCARKRNSPQTRYWHRQNNFWNSQCLCLSPNWNFQLRRASFSTESFFFTWSLPAFYPISTFFVCLRVRCYVAVGPPWNMRRRSTWCLWCLHLSPCAIHRSSSRAATRALTELKLKKCNKSAFETQVDFPFPFCPCAPPSLSSRSASSSFLGDSSHTPRVSLSSSPFHPRQALQADQPFAKNSLNWNERESRESV